MTFLALQARLVSAMEFRIRNGDVTERGFARLVGISQSHVHNVLKGARTLSPELSDRILARLGLTVLDLVEGPFQPPAAIAPAPTRPPRGKSRAPARQSVAS